MKESRAALERLLATVVEMGDPLETPPENLKTFHDALAALDPRDAARLRISEGDYTVDPRLPRPFVQIATFRSKLEQAREELDRQLGNESMPPEHAPHDDQASAFS